MSPDVCHLGFAIDLWGLGVQFDAPEWLLLIPVLGALSIWIGRKSLSGQGTTSRRVSLLVRLVVIAALSAAMAEPHWRERGEGVAVTAVLDVSKSINPQLQRAEVDYFDRAVERKPASGDLGVVTAAADAYVHALPRATQTGVEMGDVGRTDATNLSWAINLALALRPDDKAYRIVLATDGNETEGSLLQAAQAASAAGVPIDVLRLRYNFQNEVIVDELVVPATARAGEMINLRVMITATRAARGELVVQANGRTLDLDPDSDGVGFVVDLDEGSNGLLLPVPVPSPGPQEYKAVFRAFAQADGTPADEIVENNSAIGVTFAATEGRVLVVSSPTAEGGQAGDALALLEAMSESGIYAELVPGENAPQNLTELSGYDAVVLVNQPVWNFSEQQQQDLRRYVHDGGGGLLLVGGPESYGAGGWIGSTLEEALPIQLDPPQTRQMPMGALAIVLDASGSMGSPVSGTSQNQQQLANEASIAAIDTLSRLDQVVVVAFSGVTEVVVPLTQVSNKQNISRRIRSIGPGGGTVMFPGIREAFEQLMQSPAGIKHMVVLSDGHTQGDPRAGIRLAERIHESGGTISTVAVGDQTNFPLLREMADAGGGTAYRVRADRMKAELPQIFFKEAQTVKRSLIWEGDPFAPAVSNLLSGPMQSFSSVPPLNGYVVAADRDGMSVVSLRGQQGDPVMAQWQHGLGRVVTFTGDLTPRWSSAWLAWDGFEAFWEQHLRWVMRPSGSANVRVVTTPEGERTRLGVEILDEEGNFLTSARVVGRVANPDGTSQEVQLLPIGPGQYEARVSTDQAGSYVIGMRYTAAREDGETIEGSVQAAVTRPFADEYRVLEDNAALLQQVAAMTGGRMLPTDPEQAALWDDSELEMPYRSVPIWLGVALAGIALFLADVGIRRVRVDIPGLARVIVGGLRTGGESAGEQMDSLRRAREKARSGFRETKLPAEPARNVSGAKFEAEPAARGAGPALEGTPEAPVETKKRPDVGSESGEEEGMSRLLKAKRRARDEFEDDG